MNGYIGNSTAVDIVSNNYYTKDQTDAAFLKKGEQTGVVYTQQFIGTGVDDTFTLARMPDSKYNTQVFINGAYQNKDTYDVFGTTLTFTSVPLLNYVIEVMIVAAHVHTTGVTDSSLVTYLPSGIGAVETDVQSKLREIEAWIEAHSPT